MCRHSEHASALRHVTIVPAALLSLFFLQGCDHDRHHQHVPKHMSLLQVPGGSLKRQHEADKFATASAPPRDMQDKQIPVPADDDEAPLAEPPKPALKRSDWGALLQEEDSRQQDELRDTYQQMLNTNDPDQIDNAMKAAWHHMQQEDKHFTVAMQHTVRHAALPTATREPPSALAQRSDRLFAAFGSERIADEATHPRRKHRRKLMLNQQRSATLRWKAEAKASKPAASTPAKEARAAPVPVGLPSAAALDAEAATAEDADF